MSGRYGRREGRRRSVEECLTLDAVALCRAGLPGGRLPCSGEWRWSGECWLCWVLAPGPDGAPELRLLYSVGGVPVRQEVGLEATVCFGGRPRWWLLCPLRGCRVRTLFLPPGETMFGCRGCHGLTYASRRRPRPTALDRLIAGRVGISPRHARPLDSDVVARRLGRHRGQVVIDGASAAAPPDAAVRRSA